jgi:hypothetical protein
MEHVAALEASLEILPLLLCRLWTAINHHSLSPSVTFLLIFKAFVGLRVWAHWAVLFWASFVVTGILQLYSAHGHGGSYGYLGAID